MKGQDRGMRYSDRKRQGWFRQLIALLTLLSFLGQPALAAAEVLADPNAGAYKPRIDTTANGLPLVQITDPSAAGVSRNQYTTFNIDSNGAILNNSLTLTLTQQAGYVDANPNLSNSARIILNEVTGAGASSLRGYTEVAGQKAEVVIANPNGITCSGCGFINASRGMLTTGTPMFGGSGNLDAFRVTGGNITIEGAGLNASNIDQVDLISRFVNINTGLWANYLNVVTGSNQVNYADLSPRPIAGDGPAPAVSLDVSALGGMYANKIRLVGTEKGVGVVNNGAIASAGDFSLTSEGNIVLNGQTTAGNALSIQTSGDISLLSNGDADKPNTNILYSDGNMAISAGGLLTNNSTVIADQLTINARQLLNDGPSAVIATKNDTGAANFFVTDSLTNSNEASLYSLGDIMIAGSANRDSSGNYVDRTASVLNESSTIEARRDLTIAADTITNKKRDFAAEEYELSSEVKTESVTPPPGYVSNTLTYTEQVTETRVAKDADGGDRDSAPGMILAGRNIYITGSGLMNEYSTIASGNNLTMDLTGLLENIARGGWNIITTTDGQYVMGRSERFCRDRDLGVCLRWGDRIVYDVVPYAAPSLETSIFFPAGAAVISAAGNVLIEAGNINNTTQGPGSQESSSDSIPNDTANLPDFDFTMPQGGLYRPAAPNQPYLVETNPLFTDLRTFMSSDYMLERLAYDPEHVQKRLGDGFYEQKLILDQITQATGRRFLDNNTGAEDQFRALMDAGVSYAKEFNLTVGIGLSAEQMAQLTSDMVWLVEKEVQGQKVLAPVVYLSQLHADDLRPTGALIAARDIELKSASDLTNSGTIKAGYRNQIFASNIVNLGGVIDAGGATELTVTTDIVNKSGTIAGGSVALDAGRDIKNETVVETFTISPSPIPSQTEKKKDRYGLKKASAATTANNNTYTTTRVGAQATIESRGELTATAGRDIVLAGSQVKVEGDAALDAGRNLEIGSVAQKERVAVAFSGGFYERDNTTNIVSDVQTGGSLYLTVQNDATLAGAQVSAGNELTLLAGGNVAITEVKDRSLLDVKVGGGNYTRTRTDDETVIGSSLAAGGNVTVAAIPWSSEPAAWAEDQERADRERGNILIEGSSVASQAGAITLVADNDVLIKEATEHHESLTETKTTKKKTFSTKTVETRDFVSQDIAVGSSLSGDTVVIASNKDIKVRGSAVVGAGDVTLSAGNNVDITTAQQTIHEEHERKEKRSGVSTSFGKGGAGVFIGTNKTKSATDIDAVNNVGSTVGSVSGAVTITAGKDAKITGSEVISAAATDITAKNVTIDSAYNTVDSRTVFESTSSGLSIRLASEFIKNVGKAADAEKRSDQVEDGRLKALYAYQSGRALYDAYGALDKVGMNPTANLKLSVGYSTSKSRTESESHSTTAVGSRLVTNGDLVIKATGSGKDDGDLAVIGSALEGRNISLDAARDVILESAKNTYDTKSTSKSSSGGAGVSLGVNMQGAQTKGGLSVYAEGSYSRGNTDEHGLTHTETQLTAQEGLSIKSGRDTTLKGAQALAETITADVGRNLSLESEQDTETYKAANKSMSASGSYAIAGNDTKVNLSYMQSKTDSDYSSVIEQTGLFAGKGGFNITVGKNTDLKGAVIASTAEADKNSLSTETFSWSNIENKAEYKAGTTGVSLGYDSVSKGIGGTGMSGVPIVGVSSSNSESSATLAAISPGAIKIRSNKDQDLIELSRDPDKAHEALGKIFDKKKVEEQQEFAKVFGEEAFRLVGDIAKKFTKPYEKAELTEAAADNYRNLKNKKDPSEEDLKAIKYYESKGLNMGNVQDVIAQAQADMAKYQEQYDTWKEGSAIKTAMHALVGGLQAKYAGGNVVSAAFGAGAAEYSRDLTKNLSESEQQWASVIIGAAAAKLTGGNSAEVMTGAATALDGERYNRQLHKDEIERIKLIANGDKELEGRLLQAACAIVHCAEQIPNSDPNKSQALAYQYAGDALVNEKAMLLEVKRLDEEQKFEQWRTQQQWNIYTGMIGDPGPRIQPALFHYDYSDTAKDYVSANPWMGGSIQAVGGAFQTAGAIAFGPAVCTSTVLGCYGVAAVGTLGVDNTWTGIKSVWTNKYYDTNFNSTLQFMGLPPELANYIEMGANLLTPSMMATTGKTLNMVGRSLSAETQAVRIEANAASQGVVIVTPKGVAVAPETLAKQGTSPLVRDFTGLNGATVEEIVSRVPDNWKVVPQDSGAGIKFLDEAGVERIRLHGPLTNAPSNWNSSSGWVLRIMDQSGNYYDDAGNMVLRKANEGHIPIYGNPKAAQ